MNVLSRTMSTARRTAALRDLKTSPAWSRMPVRHRQRAPIVLVYGNCQAEALRRILAAHPAFARHHHLLRVPAVHETSPRELRLLEQLLPRVDVLLAQPVTDDYRGMALGTDQLRARLRPDATVIRWPVAYFEGLFPYQVYVYRDGEPVATPAPISDYHDLRLLHAARHGWDAARATGWLTHWQADAAWVRRRAEASLDELRTREASFEATLSPLLAGRLTTGFHTINHPVNELVTALARQVLERLGVEQPELVLNATQTYLDHLKAPREPSVVAALGGHPDPAEPQTWRTRDGEFSIAQVVEAHLALYATDPDLLRAGLAKHEARLADFAAAV